MRASSAHAPTAELCSVDTRPDAPRRDRSPQQRALQPPDTPHADGELVWWVLPLACVLYFFSSSGLTLFNKWFFSPTTYSFRFPLTVTFLNQLTMAVLMWPRENRSAPLRALFGPPARLHTDPRYSTVVSSVAMSGAMAGIDWGLSNVALGYISVSLYEFVKSTTPIFIACFSFSLGVAAPSLPLLGSMVLLTVGAVISVWGTHQADEKAKEQGGDDVVIAMDPFGTMCIALAVIAAGLRIVLLQRATVGQVRPAPLQASPYMAAASSAILLIPAQILEGPGLLRYVQEHDTDVLLQSCALILASAGIAVVLTVTEVSVVMYASGFGFACLGMIKQMVIVTVARVLYKDRLTTTVLVGYAVTLLGVAWYKKLRADETQQPPRLPPSPLTDPERPPAEV